jgi:hypothetical protein
MGVWDVTIDTLARFPAHFDEGYLDLDCDGDRDSDAILVICQFVRLSICQFVSVLRFAGCIGCLPMITVQWLVHAANACANACANVSASISVSVSRFTASSKLQLATRLSTEQYNSNPSIGQSEIYRKESSNFIIPQLHQMQKIGGGGGGGDGWAKEKGGARISFVFPIPTEKALEFEVRKKLEAGEAVGACPSELSFTLSGLASFLSARCSTLSHSILIVIGPSVEDRFPSPRH